MCVIMIKPCGVAMPELDVLKKMWAKNPQGAGIAFSNKRNVSIEKGFMTLASLEEYYKRAKLETFDYKLVVFHFRIGTHGLNDAGNTHPFPLSAVHKTLRDPCCTAKEAIFHNGIFRTVTIEAPLSDTGQFIVDAARAGKTAEEHWDANPQVVGWSKLCVVRPRNVYSVRGDWAYSEEAAGCLVSNVGWEQTYQQGHYWDDAWGTDTTYTPRANGAYSPTAKPLPKPITVIKPVKAVPCGGKKMCGGKKGTKVDGKKHWWQQLPAVYNVDDVPERPVDSDVLDGLEGVNPDAADQSEEDFIDYLCEEMDNPQFWKEEKFNEREDHLIRHHLTATELDAAFYMSIMDEYSSDYCGLPNKVPKVFEPEFRCWLTERFGDDSLLEIYDTTTPGLLVLDMKAFKQLIVTELSGSQPQVGKGINELAPT